jgi:polysaccharide chain length determinant protein (PEP-CTERM system associated)
MMTGARSTAMESGFTINDLRGILRRRWWIGALCLIVGVPVSVAIALALPPVYASSAKILVESQVIPEALARSTVADSAAERIQIIQQQLMTRQNLLEIAEQNRVFAGRSNMSPSDIVAMMTRATTIRGIASADRRDRAVTGMEIIFRADRAGIAAQVANDMVSRVLTQNAETRSDRASSTLAFFNQEVRRLELEVTARAAEIERFKSTSQNSLPETLTFRQSELSGLRDRQFSIAAQRASLEEQIRLVKQTLLLGAPSVAQLSPQERELAELRNQLVAQRATLNDTHPLIRQLRAQIAALEISLTTMTTDAVDGDGEGVDPGSRRVAEMEAQLVALERQLAILDDQEATITQRMAALEESIARTPTVQIQLQALERAYETLQQQLREATEKRSQAELGERLEASQQAERFQVIEQAVASDRPISPNRPMIMAAGVVGSGGLGVALMLFFEFLRRPLRTPLDVERRLDFRPIAAIPYIRSEREIARGRLWRRTAAVAALVGPSAAMIAVHLFVMPLPDLATRLVDATGLSSMIETVSRRFGG